MQKFKLLLVEDDPLLGEALQEALTTNGYQVRWTDSAASALEAISDESFDLLLQDVKLPDADGLDILRTVLSRQPGCQALVMTGQGTVEMAVRAMKLGACDFLTKPFDVNLLMMKLERVLDYRNLEKQLEQLSSDRTIRQPRIITRSATMRSLIDTVAVVAASNVSLLLHGESGTGRKLLVETIHATSTRKNGPLVRVHCAAIPASVLEEELFGVEKGSTPTADRGKPGLLESAHGGTLLFDGIDELPLTVQATLARALEEMACCRVGGTSARKLDFRLICTTAQDLKTMVCDGFFRKDLYYRVNVVTLHVPSLRERREDIPLLAAHFVNQFARNEQSRVQLSPELLDRLMLLPWPGNIRELSNLIEQLSLLYPGQTLREHHLPPQTESSLDMGTLFERIQVGMPLKDAVNFFEMRYIKRVLESLGGQKGRAAEVLGLSRKVLWEKLKRQS
ncbi:MAG: sigma-54 dependent transcriptional regulator [Desulfuromonadaceae bacterium]|nr:sigma-54 dependent transcriptional regulator [Desulfuromonadaceae bacterium]